METLCVICPGKTASQRFAQTLRRALHGHRAEIFSAITPQTPLWGRRLLFAVPLDRYGTNPEFYELLSVLRRSPRLLEGCTAGLLIDGEGTLYTKAAARSLIMAASQAGCLFPGRPLVEATGGLQNFAVQAQNASVSLEEAYYLAAENLVERVLSFSSPKAAQPRVLVLHASSRKTSNTLALWGLVQAQLPDACSVTEIGLRNGTLEDCCGCPYTTCLHFGERGDCFYGGVMVQEVYPAIRSADAVVFLCPNYNDALAANLSACINRLTALYRTTSFSQKALFGIVVSGYSGGDLVASQLVSALCMNKGFYLPPRFCMLETANDAGTAVRLPGIDQRTAAFAGQIRRTLCK